jgi:hypothetical protein
MYSGVLELKESQIMFSFGVFMSISPKRICHHTVVYSYRNILCGVAGRERGESPGSVSFGRKKKTREGP